MGGRRGGARQINLSEAPSSELATGGGLIGSSAADHLSSERGVSSAQGMSASTSDASAPNDVQLAIWGTDIVISEAKRKFNKFLKTFCDSSVDYETCGYYPTEPLYLQKLGELAKLGQSCLDVNCNHVALFDSVLGRQLACNPQEIIPAFDLALTEFFARQFPESASSMAEGKCRNMSTVLCSFQGYVLALFWIDKYCVNKYPAYYMQHSESSATRKIMVVMKLCFHIQILSTFSVDK